MEKKKRLVVIPQAGLGNRMRVIASCVQIAIKHNRTLWIAWPINSDLGCDITDIFESIGIEYEVPSRWIRFLLTNIYRHGSINRLYKFYKFFSRFFFDNCIFDQDIIDHTVEQVKILDINSNYSSLLVVTCLAFANQENFVHWSDYSKNEASRDFFQLFVFNDYLNNKVNEVLQILKTPYIGIHIRRTDQVNIIKYSPDQNFVNQIDECISENKHQKFFLATDDQTTKNFYKEKYSSNIYTLNCKLGREDLEGIYGAVVELILLSKANKIICSNISSYSSAAILMGDFKEVIYV